VIRQKGVTTVVAAYRTLVWLKRLPRVAMGEAPFEREVGSRVRAEHCLATDAFQRPLRARFQARLKAGVDRTSDVKSGRPIFSHCRRPIAYRLVFRPSAEAEPVRDDG
jgi:hypothetical protein